MATRRTCTLLRKFYNGRCLPVAITVDECWRTPDGLCLFRWGWGLGQQHLAHRLLRVLQSSMIVRSSLDNLQLLVCFGDYGLTRPAEVELAAIGMGSTVGYIYIYIYIYIYAYSIGIQFMFETIFGTIGTCVDVGWAQPRHCRQSHPNTNHGDHRVIRAARTRDAQQCFHAKLFHRDWARLDGYDCQRLQISLPRGKQSGVVV